MVKITYGQRGYVGTSMSVRQREAYDSGERPLSKWTKTDILAYVRRYYPQSVYATVEGWPQNDLKEVFLHRSSWHHTGKYADRTEFYSFKEDVEPASVTYRNSAISARKAAPKVQSTAREIWAVQDWTEWTVTRSGRRKSIDRRSVIAWTEKNGKAGMVTVYEGPKSRMSGQKRRDSFYNVRVISKPRVNSKVWKEIYRHDRHRGPQTRSIGGSQARTRPREGPGIAGVCGVHHIQGAPLSRPHTGIREGQKVLPYVSS